MAIVSFDWGGYRYAVTVADEYQDPYSVESIEALFDSLMEDLFILLHVMTNEVWEGGERCFIRQCCHHRECLLKNVEMALARRIGHKILSLLSRSIGERTGQSFGCNPQEES
jgi:hypothetical protein